uniref:Phage neck terminator protein gp12-like domain-containing protein n=1 Tax=Salmonella phage vB_SEnST11_KE23 TaxID=3161174 RepID=A0AAU8GFS9_9CAUD
MAGFTNSDEIFDALTNTVGAFCKETTGRKVVLAGEDEIPKVDGEFILVDLTAVDQIDWQSDEGVDTQGNAMTVHNYEVVYTLTAYRGKAPNALSRVLQAMNLPFIYDKYFPTNSPFAYSSSSTISRLRVPLNMQKFETRAVVLITFNVCFIETDTGAFEDLEKINAQLVYHYPAEG